MSNNFLQFDPAKNNIQSDGSYTASSYRLQGAQSGIAPSNVHNKLFYQVSTMVAALGSALSAKGYTVSDASISDLITVLGNIMTLADMTPYEQVNSDWDAVSGKALILNKPATDFMPTGAILPWSTATPPTGYLECSGASVLRATYPNLFAVIGTDYGSADGTHFTLPDLRGVFLRGWDHGAARDPDAATRTNRGDGTSGDFVGTRQVEATKAHTHTGAATWPTAEVPPTVGVAEQNQDGGPSDYTQFGVNTGSTGGSETRPVNVNVMYIIKT